MDAEKFTLLSNFPYAHPAPKLLVDSALSTSETQVHEPKSVADRTTALRHLP